MTREQPMLEQYKRTFIRIQTMILFVSCAVFFAAGHRLPAAAVFFAMMQVGAVAGAMWGARLRRKIAAGTISR